MPALRIDEKKASFWFKGCPGNKTVACANYGSTLQHGQDGTDAGKTLLDGGWGGA